MSQGSSERKKLLLMSPMLHQGGFEKVCVETARLMQDVYDVTILIFSDKNIQYDITGLNVHNLNLPAVKNRAGKVVNLLRRILATRRFKKLNRFDYAYSFGSSANYVNVLSKAGEKVITGIRCSTDVENVREVTLFCDKSDKVYSCSRDILTTLREEFGYLRGRYIYNPVDIDAIRQAAEEELPEEYKQKTKDQKVIITLGRDDIIKGHWHLIRAFSETVKAVPEAVLVILGAGSYEKGRRLARALGIEDHVIFGGNRKNPFPFVAASDLYVLASNHEGFPNALLEAMALARPVIAADCKTGPREILFDEEAYDAAPKVIRDADREGYGILIPDLGAEEDYETLTLTATEQILAREMTGLLKDDAARTLFGRRALEGAKRFTKQRYKERLKGLLQEA